METMKEFEGTSGLQINNHKSALFTAGLSDYELTLIQQLVGFPIGNWPVRYLGISLTTKKLSIVDYTPLIDKISTAINVWSAKTLSYAERTELISTVLQGIECYWLKTFHLPVVCTDRIISLCRNFFWGSKTASVAWKDVCLPKEEGCLGLRDIRIWNKALMTKSLWNIHSKKDFLWINEAAKTMINSWFAMPNGSSNAYHWLRRKGEPKLWNSFIWKVFIPQKYSFCMWLAICGGLATRDRLGYLGIDQTTEIIVYVVDRHLSSSKVGSSNMEVRNPSRDDYVPYFPQYYEALAVSSTAGFQDTVEGASSNWVVPFTDLDIAGPLSWDEGPTTQTNTLYKGAIFRTKDYLTLANRVEYIVYRSNKKWLGYVCKHGSVCPFKLCAIVDGLIWRIYKFNDTHTCHLDMSRIATRQVPARVLAKYFVLKLVNDRVVLNPKEMMTKLIDYSFTLREKNIAIEMIYGDSDKSYEQLFTFLHILQLINPGTVYDMQITREDRFKHLFLLSDCVFF
ncbi:hypothetical protein C2S51_030190 [Perilla frutescens var. frutescens]|nr:hypothetical protein C2S51_030190 [Perilla frutescens var. frutescens]